MLRGLREKIKAEIADVIDNLGTKRDIDDISYPFREVRQDFKELGDVFRDGFSRNNRKLKAELTRDTERQAELEPFLEPSQGGTFTAPDGRASREFFKYDPLPDGDLRTRVLTLRGGKDLETIECTLESVNLDNPGLQYEALSYCWGAPGDGLTPIYCNGRQLNVTRNLKMALNNLRPTHGERTLWIDAICINQTDKQECARQVLKMGDIYGRATRVVVWIGETSTASRVSFDILGYLSKLYDDAGGRTLQYEEMRDRAARMAIDGYPAQMTFNRAFKIMQVMEEADWFTRMWVLQEVALARAVSVACGRQALSWDTLEKGMLVRALVATRDRRSRRMLLRRFDVGVLKVIELRMALVKGKQDRSILHLLNQFRGHQATVAADKVYAILSLTDTDVNDIGLDISYSIPTAQLYTDLAKGILRHAPAGGLELLSVPHASSELAGNLPSWVPDWSDSAGGARPLVSSVSRYGNGKFCSTGEPALDSTACDFKGSHLILHGYVLDRIGRMSTQPLTDIEPHLEPPSASSEMEDGAYSMTYELERSAQEEQFYKPIKKAWIRFLRHPPALPPTLPRRQSSPSTSSFEAARQSASETARQTEPEDDGAVLAAGDMRHTPYPPTSELLGVAYVRTLCADSFPPFIPLEPATYKVLINALELSLDMGEINPHGMWNVMQRLVTLGVDGDNASSDLPPIEFPLSTPSVVDFGGMMDVMIGRRLMWSRDGYFGAVPADAKEGDAIMLVKGCRVPLVVRRRPGEGETESAVERGKTEWQLVGDCFMHGAMYGERWRAELCEEVIFV